MRERNLARGRPWVYVRHQRTFFSTERYEGSLYTAWKVNARMLNIPGGLASRDRLCQFQLRTGQVNYSKA
jgi:hypothetical protein